MRFKQLAFVTFLLCAFCAFLWPKSSSALEIIAHRGASAYAPENTLASEKMAQKMGADWLEADIVATKDHQLILSHDLWLEDTTDIARRFPTRKRRDGHFYALDFSLAQLKTLSLKPRVEKSGPRYPNRKINLSGARITTLAELLSLKNGTAGFYLEPKAPRWHRQNGFDISKALLTLVRESNIPTRRVWLECFDPTELKRLKSELRSPYRQTQLIGGNDERFDPNGQHFDFDAMRTPAGLKSIKLYAQAIGPRIDFVINGLGVSNFVAQAHAAGLEVHPYVFQTDRFPFAPPLTQNWIRAFERARIEALFTDQPDVVRSKLAGMNTENTDEMKMRSGVFFNPRSLTHPCFLCSSPLICSESLVNAAPEFAL
jgi:glycerophosphoryl diester phosphodiesterase